MAKVYGIDKGRYERKTLNALKQLRNNSLLCILDGDYRGYKTTQRDFAKLAVKNPNLLDELDGKKVKVPLFSKTGLNFLKVWFLNLFRRKTPEEKELKKIATRKHLAKTYNINNMG